MSEQDKIQLFENQPIRTAWNEEQEEWYFSTGRRLQTDLISWMRIAADLWCAETLSNGINYWPRPHEAPALSRQKSSRFFRMPDIWACMVE